MQCLDEPDLEALLHGNLDEPAADAARIHLEQCRTCRAHFEQIGENLELVGPLRQAMQPPTEPTIRQVGQHEIIRRLGEGATSVVYLARQIQPQRTVAIKLLRPEHMSGETLDRFTAEANILAKLHHRGIATIFEAGAADVYTEDGFIGRRAFLAMEYIDGPRLDEYAKQRQLTVQQRLELIASVADAVHHAHLKGVIHRDVKPSNILIRADGNTESPAQPKVLDFGVARALDTTWDQLSATSTTSGLIGTLPYMSPEQIEGDPGQIDARSDIYGLGVLTFELLTGELPHEVRQTSLVEAARRITDQPPKRLRAVDPQFAGDIDAIVGKALSRQPERRYESAAAFAADLRRHLTHQAVTARPPTALYQLSRVAMRHRGMVAAVVLGLLALVAALGVTNWYAHQANTARTAAEHRLDEALDASMALVDMIAARMKDLPGTYEARLVLAEDVHEYLSDLHAIHPDHPKVQSSLWISKRLLSALLRHSGNGERASALMDESFELMKAAYERDPEDPELRFEYAYTLRYLMHPPEEAHERMRESTERMVALHEDFPDDRIYLREAAVGLRGLAVYEIGAGRHGEAEALLARSQRLLEQLCAAEPDVLDHQTIFTRGLLTQSELYRQTERNEDAEDAAAQALTMAERMSERAPGHSGVMRIQVDALMHLADLTLKRDDTESCLEHVDRCIPIARQLAASDPDIGKRQSVLEQAERLRERALAAQTQRGR